MACGLILGTVLLAQIVGAYRFASNDLLQREAQRETNRKIVDMEQMARVRGAQDIGHLSEIVNQTAREAPTQIAWVRILQLDGTPIVAVGAPAQKLYSPSRMQQAIESHEILSKITETPSGRVLITARPFHPDLGPYGEVAGGEYRNSPPPPLAVEIAIYLDSVAAPFGPLRFRVLTGSIAALALMIAMIVIGLRFRPYLLGKQLQQQADVARAVQLDLMPPMESIPEDLDFAGLCIPAWQVGGDFYDVFTDKNGRIGLMLTDVAGKGLPAALLSSLIQGALRASSWTTDALLQAGAAATQRFLVRENRARTICRHGVLLLRTQDIHSALRECWASATDACPPGIRRKFLGTATGQWRTSSGSVPRRLLSPRTSYCRSGRLAGHVLGRSY